MLQILDHEREDVCVNTRPACMNVAPNRLLRIRLVLQIFFQLWYPGRYTILVIPQALTVRDKYVLKKSCEIWASVFHQQFIIYIIILLLHIVSISTSINPDSVYLYCICFIVQIVFYMLYHFPFLLYLYKCPCCILYSKIT